MEIILKGMRNFHYFKMYYSVIEPLDFFDRIYLDEVLQFEKLNMKVWPLELEVSTYLIPMR